MEWQTILWIILTIILLYTIIYYVTKDRSTLNKNVTAGNLMTTITPSSADTYNSSNFTYSVWFYINDWNYRYGERKSSLWAVGY